MPPPVSDKAVEMAGRHYKMTERMRIGPTPAYGVCFNTLDSRYSSLLAAVGKLRIVVLDMKAKVPLFGSMRQLYEDPDENEHFFTVCWGGDLQCSPLICAAGQRGVIRVIDYRGGAVRMSLTGHGACINEVRVHPLKPWLLLSASRDESVRMWNIHTGVCVGILAGIGGHRNQVLSVDFHPVAETLVASSGMDGTVRIWNLQAFAKGIENSSTWADKPSMFPIFHLQHPMFTGDTLHDNFTDCVRFCGNLILSKSVSGDILFWKFLSGTPWSQQGMIRLQEPCVLAKFPIPSCDIWFMRFSVDFSGHLITVGNTEGSIFAFDIRDLSGKPLARLKISNPDLKTLECIRYTSVSQDRSNLVACTESGWLYRWEEVHPGSGANGAGPSRTSGNGPCASNGVGPSTTT